MHRQNRTLVINVLINKLFPSTNATLLSGCTFNSLVDIRKAIQRLPSVQLSEDTAFRLKSNLGLSYGWQMSLREIVQKWLSGKKSHTLSELVSILILTPAVGKYVRHLLPHCELASPE